MEKCGVLKDLRINATALIDEPLTTQIAHNQPLRYAGYVYDEYSQMYYCAQRYYDPATQVFVSLDPARADGERSGYLYCGGDPVNNTDPSGLKYIVKKKTFSKTISFEGTNTLYYCFYKYSKKTKVLNVKFGICTNFVETLEYGLSIFVNVQKVKNGKWSSGTKDTSAYIGSPYSTQIRRYVNYKKQWVYQIKLGIWKIDYSRAGASSYAFPLTPVYCKNPFGSKR